MSNNSNGLEEAGNAFAGLGCLVLYILIGFPGGTIFMAIMVPNKELSGLDWVLSVIIPGFGLIKGLLG